MNESDAQDRYVRARDLFLEVCDMPPETREDHLVRGARGDDALLAHVRELLAQHDSTGDGSADTTLGFHAFEQLLGADVTIGEYRLGDVLGRGGMGVVYAAEHRRTGAEVAIKIVAPGIVSDAPLPRFLRETKVLQKLGHPGIAAVLDVGSAETPAGPLHYFAMKRIDGVTLRRYVLEQDPPIEERLRLMSAIGAAVQHAHERGVVHRDLKPENIMVQRNGTPILLDFGIARLASLEHTHTTLATRTGQLLGTIRYMSPEQARGDLAALDVRSDVYSLGVIFHELVCGKLPYAVASRSHTALLLAIASSRPVQLCAPSAPLERALMPVLEIALQKDPRDRYASAGPFRRDVEAVRAGRSPARAPLRRARRVGRRVAGLRALRWGGGLSLMLLGLVAGVLLWRDHVQDERAEAAVRRLAYLTNEANVRIQRGTRTKEGLEEALGYLDEARRLLAESPVRPYTTAAQRFVEWRSGEAFFFLAHLESDADRFLDANAYWEVATTYSAGPRWTEDLPPAGNLWREVELVARRHIPWSGRALAHAGLANYRSPVDNWRMAIQNAREALDAWEWMMTYAPIPDDRAPDGRALVHLDLGGYLVSLGVATDSLPAIEEGLQLLDQVSADSLWDELKPARAVWFSTQAHAHFALWDLLAEPGHFARADSFHARGIVLRHELGGRPNYAAIRVHSDAYERAAALASGSSERRRLLDAAATDIGAARASVGDRWFVRAHMDIALADHLAHRIWLVGNESRGEAGLAALATADSLLQAAGMVMQRAKYPLQYLELALTDARVARARHLLTGAASDRRRAADRLDEIETILVADEYPLMSRLVREERERLEAVTPRSP